MNKTNLLSIFVLIFSFSLASASSSVVKVLPQSCYGSDGTYPPYTGYNVQCNNSKVKFLDGNYEINGYPQATGGFETFNYLNTNLCKQIINVSLCYKWFRQTDAQVQFECQIFASKDNGNNWESASGVLNNDCPVNDESSAIFQCKDVSTLLNWTCGNFFNPSVPNRSAIKFQVTDAGSENALLFLDTAFYQVVYQPKAFCTARKT